MRMHMSWGVGLLVLLFVTTGSATAAAQHVDSLQAGARVRAREAPQEMWRDGTLTRPVGDLVAYKRCRNCFENILPITATTELQVSVGPRFSGDRILKGMLVGTLVGGGVGAAAGYLQERGTDCDVYCGIAPAFFGAVGAALGFTVGVVAGAQPVDHWVPVRMR